MFGKTEEKCRQCPYHLGMIKPIIDPCIKCRMDKRKTPPFPKPILKKTKDGMT